MAKNSSAHFHINPHYRLQWEPAQNCYVLLYPEGLVQLSESAAAILQHCQNPVSETVVIALLEQQFPGADLADDVCDFLQDAFQQEWLVSCE